MMMLSSLLNPKSSSYLLKDIVNELKHCLGLATGVQSTLMSSLKGPNGEVFPKQKQTLLLHHCEKSLRARRKRDRGHHVCNAERLYVVLADDGCLVPYRTRQNFSGTSRGEIMGPIPAPSWEAGSCLHSAVNICQNQSWSYN